MIYVNGLKGRKGYQKLSNVLEFDANTVANKEGYETFSKTVDEKYKTFNEEMKKKQYKTNFSNKSNIFLYRIF